MRKSLVVAALTAASLSLASCAMPADDPNFNASAELGGLFSEDAASEAAAADEATTSIEDSLVAPTSIGVDAPLSAAPAAGSLIVNLSDGSDGDTLLSASMAEAAETIGWTFQEVAGADSAETAPQAFEEALALNPAGIRIPGTYVDYLVDGLAQAEAAGIPVVCTGCSGEPTGAIKDTSIDGDAQNMQWADLLSAYVSIKRQPDEDAAVEMFSLPGPALATFNSQFAGNLSELCRECAAQEDVIDDTNIDDVPTFVADTMSISLGRWALFDSGSLMPGVADALATADLFDPAIIIGRAPGAEEIAVMAATPVVGGAATPEATPGASPEASAAASDEAAAVDEVAGLGTPEEAAALQAWTGLPIPVMGWRVVDQFARILGGDALADGPLPSQLITPANAGQVAVDESGNYLGVADYKEQFTALWGVG